MLGGACHRFYASASCYLHLLGFERLNDETLTVLGPGFFPVRTVRFTVLQPITLLLLLDRFQSTAPRHPLPLSIKGDGLLEEKE